MDIDLLNNIKALIYPSMLALIRQWHCGRFLRLALPRFPAPVPFSSQYSLKRHINGSRHFHQIVDQQLLQWLVQFTFQVPASTNHIHNLGGILELTNLLARNNLSSQHAQISTACNFQHYTFNHSLSFIPIRRGQAHGRWKVW